MAYDQLLPVERPAYSVQHSLMLRRLTAIVDLMVMALVIVVMLIKEVSMVTGVLTKREMFLMTEVSVMVKLMMVVMTMKARRAYCP